MCLVIPVGLFTFSLGLAFPSSFLWCTCFLLANSLGDSTKEGEGRVGLANVNDDDNGALCECVTVVISPLLLLPGWGGVLKVCEIGRV